MNSPRLGWVPGFAGVPHRNPRILFVIVALFAVSGCQQPSSRPADPGPPPGAEIFLVKCSSCHAADLANTPAREAEVWLDTIQRLEERPGTSVGRDEIVALVHHHVEQQRQCATVFLDNCQRCHPGRAGLPQQGGAAQARMIIRSVQQQAGNVLDERDLEIVVGYHVRAQQAAFEKPAGVAVGRVLRDQPETKVGLALFLKKCSTCHEADRALSVIKDPEVWAQTVRRMQHYSKGAITDPEAAELIDFHVTQQQREIDAFRETCTRCHDDERINSRSLSEEQWLETIRRMQQKAPELISDEKVNLLAAYFHRRELTLARIFDGKCRLCHLTSSGEWLLPGSGRQADVLVVLAKGELGESLRFTDANNLRSVHVQRQQRLMRLFEERCTTCHADDAPEKIRAARRGPAKRTRAEWLFFIATLQEEGFSKEAYEAINFQIDYHIFRQQ